jgi:N-acetylmuramoyl-L-alanine amidase
MSRRSIRHFALLALIPPLVLALMVALNGGVAPQDGGSATTTVAGSRQKVRTVSPPPVDAAASPARTTADPPARKVVVLDPGHGGEEVGAAANGVVEKTSNLDMAMRVQKLLEADGYDVVLTRTTDARAAEPVDGYTATRTDLQARIDEANAAHGDVFVSLHSNGSDDASQQGVEAWYDSKRDFATENQALARSLLTSVLSQLHDYGYDAQDRGLLDGNCFRERMGRCFTLFVIGGPRETTREEVTRRGGDPEALGFNGAAVIYSRATAMPAALIEDLIITNGADSAVLRDDAGRQAIARGVANGIEAFLSNPQ